MKSYSQLSFQLEQKEALHKEAQEVITALEKKVICLEMTLEHKKESLEEKIRLTENSEERLRESFKSLSHDLFMDHQSTFLNLANSSFAKVQHEAQQEFIRRQDNIQLMLKPLQENLSKMEDKIADLEKARLVAYTSLSEQLGMALSLHQALRDETANLVKALRQPQVRGRWGEMQLRRAVELSGMEEHCDFNLQASVEEGDSWRRPDMLVRLPAGRTIVVDAKTPLASYLDAIECSDELERGKKLADHARQVRYHIEQLSKKNYWSLFKQSPEFVILFLPGEPFFSTALQIDPMLMEFGVESKVFVATPMTLIALLRSIAYGWRQEPIARNAAEISLVGRQLYERLAIFAEHFTSIKRGLDQTVRSYNNAVASFESRLGVAAKRLGDLGINPQREIKALDEIDLKTRSVSIDEKALFNDSDKLLANREELDSPICDEEIAVAITEEKEEVDCP